MNDDTGIDTVIERGSDVGVLEREDVEGKEPNMFKVIFHNDNVTTVDFVISILMAIFNKDTEAAIDITVSVHENGKGIAGMFTHEIAETKTDETLRIARSYGFPLLVTFEEDC